MTDPQDDLASAIRALNDEVDDEMRQRWSRSLPFQDAMFDRWDRAARLGFGAEASIYNSAIVLGDVRAGESTWIGPYVMLDGSGGGIEIGSFCSISAGTHIYTHDTVLWSVTLGQASRNEGRVVVGTGCHIGAQSVIGPGTVIGERSVIGANSYVNRSIPPLSVAVGSPAKVVGRVEIGADGARLVYRERE